MEPENLHLTLRFAGDIDNAHAREFADRLAGISVDAFEMRLVGLGAFGGNEPRSIWAGVEAGPELEALARANERAARAAGLPPEGRTLQAARDGGALEIRQRPSTSPASSGASAPSAGSPSRSGASCCFPRAPRSAAGPTWSRRHFRCAAASSSTTRTSKAAGRFRYRRRWLFPPQKHSLKLAWVPPFGGMTLRGAPATGAHASLRENDGKVHLKGRN